MTISAGARSRCQTREHDSSDDNITAKTVLDFGCGTGEMALYLGAKHPAKIIGVDVDPVAVIVEKAQAAKANRVEFVLPLLIRSKSMINPSIRFWRSIAWSM